MTFCEEFHQKDVTETLAFPGSPTYTSPRKHEACLHKKIVSFSHHSPPMKGMLHGGSEPGSELLGRRDRLPLLHQCVFFLTRSREEPICIKKESTHPMRGPTRIRTKQGHLTEQCLVSPFIAPNAKKWGALTTSQCRVFVLIGPITAPNARLGVISVHQEMGWATPSIKWPIFVRILVEPLIRSNYQNDSDPYSNVIYLCSQTMFS